MKPFSFCPIKIKSRTFGPLGNKESHKVFLRIFEAGYVGNFAAKRNARKTATQSSQTVGNVANQWKRLIEKGFVINF